MTSRHGGTGVRLRSMVTGQIAISVEILGPGPAVVVRSDPRQRRGALSCADGVGVAEAAHLALTERIPLVWVVSSSGAAVDEGLPALHGWGQAARAMAACSGIVPIALALVGPAVSGPALMLGLADVVVMTPEAFAFISGPAMVRQFTGVGIDIDSLGGPGVHSRHTGLAALTAQDAEHAMELLAEILGYLPPSADELTLRRSSCDPVSRSTPKLENLLPAGATGSYDMRQLAVEIVDDSELLELRSRWAPQLFTALARVGGQAVGIVGNQPQAMAGTLDIAASQKGARFVSFCDSFNLPIITLVDTPGFLPGKDLEWRGMIRHGAELAFAYAQASVPRVCLIVRKAYGGAYIVMDSKKMGSDVCLAWPSAEIAVMGAKGAVAILNRGTSASDQEALAADYEASFLTPWIAAERGYVDMVIEPASTRRAVADALVTLGTKRETPRSRKHANGPL
ncbi:MAG: acyl-CoA carboxylase subunit beta [Acidimicrobiales bacterium]